MIRVLAITTALALVCAPSRGEQAPESAECRDLNQVTYASPDPQRLKQVSVSAGVNVDLAGHPAELSPQGTGRLFLLAADMTKPGPWSSTIVLVGNRARPLAVTVRVDDHANGGVRAQWLNEKLLFLQVWWGRIISTDFLLNVETRQFLYAEDANYGMSLMPCNEREM